MDGGSGVGNGIGKRAGELKNRGLDRVSDCLTESYNRAEVFMKGQIAKTFLI